MKLKQYIFLQLSITFLPIFFGLFFITSIIFLVKIASLTSIITIDVFELLTLYLYSVPNILFFTLPISFFISMVISLGKLSAEYELIVISSFGLNPLKILKIFLPITVILTVSMLIISLGLIPKTKHLTNKMIFQKQTEANFNIKESEFGQRFGNWLIYIENKKDKEYFDVKLFKTDGTSDQFIISKTAILNNKKGDLNFTLKDGKSFVIKQNELNQIDFKSMKISDTMVGRKIEPFLNPKAYWERRMADDKDKFAFYVLTSLFPLISLFLVIAFGYFNPRYEKNKSNMYAILFAVIYYASANYLAKHIYLTSIYILPAVWVIITYFVYSKKIKELY